MKKVAILTVPNPLLRQKSKPVPKIDTQIKKLIGAMIDFLKTGPQGKLVGVGLSAPQIGQLLRIVIIWSKTRRRFLPMINPVIVEHSQHQKLGIANGKSPYEGCLSVPNVWAKVRRYPIVKVNYQTIDDQQIVHQFKGFLSVVVQHEIDHLDGILFVDRVLQQKGKFYQIGKDQKGKETLEEIKLT
jgi:peptide deformylase